MITSRRRSRPPTSKGVRAFPEPNSSICLLICPNLLLKQDDVWFDIGFRFENHSHLTGLLPLVSLAWSVINSLSITIGMTLESPDPKLFISFLKVRALPELNSTICVLLCTNLLLKQDYVWFDIGFKFENHSHLTGLLPLVSLAWSVINSLSITIGMTLESPDPKLFISFLKTDQIRQN